MAKVQIAIETELATVNENVSGGCVGSPTVVEIVTRDKNRTELAVALECENGNRRRDKNGNGKNAENRNPNENVSEMITESAEGRTLAKCMIIVLN
jgi:hypothetical protein